jgi:hypothetical protein
MVVARFCAVVCIYMVVCAGALAQQTLDGYRMPVTTLAFETDDLTLAADAIVRDHDQLFYATDSLGRVNHKHAYWFRLDFQPDRQSLSGLDTIYLVTGILDKATLYYGNDRLQSVSLDYTTRGRNYHDNDLASLTIPVPVSALIEGRYVYFNVSFSRSSPNLRGLKFYYNTPSAEMVHRNFIRASALKGQIPLFILIGIAGLLLIFNLLLFSGNKERQYLYYSGFLLFQVIYYSRGSPLVANFLFQENHFLNFLSTEVAQVAANVCYLLFVKHFLDTRQTLPLLNKVLHAVALVLVTFIVVDTILLISNPFFPYQSDMMWTHRYVMSSFALMGVVYLIFKAQGNLRFFIIGGTICYAGGALATMFARELNYMIFGSALESIIFALGLSYKIRAINREKLRIEREANQVRLSALRAQMNPHFIFNSLNSIQHLISRNDKVNALTYLNKFSTLLRQVLESSINVNIPIKDEIQLLRIYLELESLRFDRAFQYHIVVDDQLDVHNLELPILLLQPYVENAICHGLLPKANGPKELTIAFSDQTDYVLCEIRDTGIGREAALERKQNMKIDRPSRGMELTRQRIGLINNGMALEELITFQDSVEGTTVIIKIPKN